ncbi:MAG TPA: type VI secretion system membrane subunit TssM [Acetobacteraceae bacterium]|nr:type VI secretion system membrane subunit TssM [Acetobacteraceae bacterium]
MPSVARTLLSRWTVSFVGTALLAWLVWAFGPLEPAFETWGIRLAIVVVILLVWAVANLLLELRQRVRDTALTAGLTADAAEETAALREKLATALRLLKKKRKSRGYLYEQPWYAIIGPPGAGKTTALLNAGLHFPLADEMGQGALAGVGGTRLCEWWFADEAVLIDTAGRYTTHDSNAAVDRSGWDAFLDLLHSTRPRQPLNGVLVAISLSDIAQAPAMERMAHARAIRQRTRELETRLGVRLPVYALFTKADLISGFVQFFDDLDRAQRAQVWGTTFALSDGSPAGFSADFRALVERLNLRMYQRLQAEPNPDRRAQIAMFPTQVASLEQPLTEFIEAAFGSAGTDRPPLLRGVYLTSGTQEGTPIDRLLGTLSRAFGLDQNRAAPLRAGQGRSYFLDRLLRDVVFGEAMLVASSPRAARTRAISRAAGFAVALLVVLAAGTLLWRVRDAGARQIEAAQTALNGYEQTAHAFPLDPVDDADMPRLLPLLNAAGKLAHEMAAAAAQSPPWWTLGLSQSDKLAASARAVYRHALENALLPRLIWRLEAQLRGSMGQPAFLYEATRVYLMLGNAGPLDHDLVHEWMRLDWEAAYPGAEFAQIREALLGHLDALLAEPLPTVSLDGALVTQARSTFAGVSMAQRAYSRLRPSAAAQRLPEWRPADALGAAGVGLFVRASGKPLNEGIPGFFTAEGFHKVLLPSLDSSARDVVSESWVLGQRVQLDPNGPQMQALHEEIVALYETDFARRWDAMLADLDLVQMRSLPRAAQDLYILESPESPMRALLLSIAHQLRLSVGRPVQDASVANADTSADQLRAVLGTTQSTEAAPSLPGHEIDNRYRTLLKFVGGDGPGAPIDEALKSLIDIQQEMAKMAAAAVGSPPPTGTDPAIEVEEEATRLPQPVLRWFASIAASGTALRGGSSRAQLAAVFNAPGGPAEICPATVNGRYPFVPGVTNDVSIAEFSRLFAPGGTLDGFQNTLLRPYIDMSASPWRPKPADGVAAPITPADLLQFQHAADIRDMFFAAGSTTPSIRFDVTPLRFDRATHQVTLDIAGTTVIATHDPPRSTQIIWPGPSQAEPARLAFDPPTANPSSTLQEYGPWAIFRLFSRGNLQRESAQDHYTLTFRVGNRTVAFDLHASAGLTPFVTKVLQDFRCPKVNRP